MAKMALNDEACLFGEIQVRAKLGNLVLEINKTKPEFITHRQFVADQKIVSTGRDG